MAKTKSASSAKKSRLVLGLSGSLRRANTDAVVKAVLAAPKNAGARTRFIRLADLDVTGCVACYYCHTHTTCRIKDDMTKVYNAIKSADAVVFGTPVYWFTMSAQLKGSPRPPFRPRLRPRQTLHPSPRRRRHSLRR